MIFKDFVKNICIFKITGVTCAPSQSREQTSRKMSSYRPHIAGNTHTLKSRDVALCTWRGESALECGKQPGGMFPLNDKFID
ncbi:MAG TPA: hypothetical protein PLV98_09665 [Dysgonamonadaceae bacterium]|nr:hypothetical protein [Dysgonamonadaceae bacterium]